MALDPDLQKALLVNRFGFVPKAGSLALIGDARATLLAELDDSRAGRIQNVDLLDSAAASRAAFIYQQGVTAKRLAARVKQKDSEGTPKAEMDPAVDTMQPAAGMIQNDGMSPPRNQTLSVPQQIYRQEAKARFDAAFDAPIGFAERLVWFWSNHFCISADKAAVRPISGAFEREAIRPNITGSFADMLIAAESHPGMLLYLDNARSIGPNSQAGRRRGRGLNENLAREILELHTVGVKGGYTQDDVTSLAKVITGWTVVSPRQDPVHGGRFTFNPRQHEPGPQQVMGRSFKDHGVQQGRAVLMMLARHPATATHIARKLVRHFVTDDPSPLLVERLAKVFLETDGNLKALSRALVIAPEAAELRRGKLRPPAEWLIGIARATGERPESLNPLLQAHNLLGQPLWRPPAPKGFSDDSNAWLDGIAARLDVANQFARRNPASGDVRVIAEQALGPLLTPDTRQTIDRAESQQQALVLLLMSSEFQRR